MVYLFLAEGFEEVEALTVVDLLRRAKCEVTSVSVTGSKAVCGGHGITAVRAAHARSSGAFSLYKKSSYTK